jgi:hypothetical protein
VQNDRDDWVHAIRFVQCAFMLIAAVAAALALVPSFLQCRRHRDNNADARTLAVKLVKHVWSWRNLFYLFTTGATIWFNVDLADKRSL